MADDASVRFAQEDVRSLAEQIARLYYRARASLDVWDARDLAIAIAKTADPIDAGAAQPGLPRITGLDVHANVDVIRSLVVALEANEQTNLKALLRVSINPTSR